MKKNLIEVFEEWRKGWSTPDIYILEGKDKKKKLLREHTIGEVPFVNYQPLKSKG